MRIQDRIDGAVERAASRYCGEFTATTASGDVMKLVAVKRDADFETVDSAISSRRFEFVVAPSSARSLIKLTGGTALQKNLDALRKIVIREFQNGEQVAEYRIDAARPLAENTPTGGVLRLFVYQVKG